MPYKTIYETSAVTGGTRGRSLAEPRRPCREWTYPARQSAMRQGCLMAVMSVRQTGVTWMERRGPAHRGKTRAKSVRKDCPDCCPVRKVPVAGRTLELPPGPPTGMAIGPQVAQPQPAAIATATMRTKVP